MKIAVYGSFEAAHRLTSSPGNCSNIHGHSWRVRLELEGPLDNYGMVKDFRDVKKLFREHLSTYDHRLILNSADRLVGADLPGEKLVPGDPTTENIAKWIWEWAHEEYVGYGLSVVVRETEHNEAVCP